MKKLLLAIGILASIPALCQHNLIVRRNQVKNIVNATRFLIVDTLVLEDNSTILLADDVQAFSLIAKYATIGNNVKIDGSRKALPVSGANGTNGTRGTGSCDNGVSGGFGTTGSNGLCAADIFLYVQIRAIGSMTVDTKGSPGGSGGNGGNGGDAIGGGALCTGAYGGNGGGGGNGGNGGDGGAIVLNYVFIDANGNILSSQPSLMQVTFSFAGSPGGAGGRGGTGGASVRPLGGTSSTQAPAGSNGRNGLDGKAGYVIKNIMRQKL